MLDLIIQIIHLIVGGLCIVFGWLILSGNAYFSKKGENKAMQEDIEELTELAESIKSKLDYLSQTKISIKTEERNALVEAYEKYNSWLGTITDNNLTEVGADNYDLLLETKNNMSRAKNQFEIAYAKMQLFVNNKDLMLIAIELKSQTFKLQSHVVGFTIKLMEWQVKMRGWNAGAGLPGGGNRDALNVILDEKTALFTTYYAEIEEKYNPIIALDGKFQTIAYQHIQALITE